jgi:hypothetical protein
LGEFQDFFGFLKPKVRSSPIPVQKSTEFGICSMRSDSAHNAIVFIKHIEKAEKRNTLYPVFANLISVSGSEEYVNDPIFLS